ncbi:MAG: hypothetical protein ABI693_06120 [Bryobacteraceae bacterium]
MQLYALFSLLLLAGPFWEAQPPADWTVEELMKLFTDSPWSQGAEPSRQAPGTAPVQVYFATAQPMRQAEAERRRRFGKKGTEETFAQSEYREFLEQDGGKSIVIAIRIRDLTAMADSAEMGRMESESLLHVGRRKYKVSQQFPASTADPYVRLVFPRQVSPEDKRIDLDLYIPGVAGQYRQASFNMKEMMVAGKLEL